MVLGAAGTLGRAICAAFAEAGARVHAVDLDVDAARSAINGLPGAGHAAAAADTTVPASVAAAVDEAFAAGPVDSTVYAAGVTFTRDVAESDWSEYRRLMAVNLDGAFHVSAAVGRRLLDGRHGGAITIIASTAGKRGEAGAAAYCASKFGVLGLVESFAAEVAAAGIRVNALCPGNVESPMLERVARMQAERTGAMADALLASYAAEAAAGRLVRPEEVAQAALWLSSPAASGVTGESLNVDAGALAG